MSKWIIIEEGCVWPKSEQVVEVKLSNGFVGFALFDCNIQDAGDWDLMPLDENGDPTMDTVSDQAVAWREAATALDRLSGRVKPPDLSNLLRHAVLSGVILARNSPKATGPELWPHYDPAECAAYARILAALDTAPVPDPAQIRREALEEAKQIALRVQAEEEAHSGDIALERAGAAEEIADEIEALITEEAAPDPTTTIHLYEGDSALVIRAGSVSSEAIGPLRDALIELLDRPSLEAAIEALIAKEGAS